MCYRLNKVLVKSLIELYSTKSKNIIKYSELLNTNNNKTLLIIFIYIVRYWYKNDSKIGGNYFPFIHTLGDP